MWILLLVLFSGPMQVERVDVLEMYWTQQACIDRVIDAETIGIPQNMSVGCVHVREIAKA